MQVHATVQDNFLGRLFLADPTQSEMHVQVVHGMCETVRQMFENVEQSTAAEPLFSQINEAIRARDRTRMLWLVLTGIWTLEPMTVYVRNHSNHAQFDSWFLFMAQQFEIVHDGLDYRTATDAEAALFAKQDEEKKELDELLAKKAKKQKKMPQAGGGVAAAAAAAAEEAAAALQKPTKSRRDLKYLDIHDFVVAMAFFWVTDAVADPHDPRHKARVIRHKDARAGPLTTSCPSGPWKPAMRAILEAPPPVGSTTT